MEPTRVLHRFMVASSRGLSIMTIVRALRDILCFGSWSVATVWKVDARVIEEVATLPGHPWLF